MSSTNWTSLEHAPLSAGQINLGPSQTGGQPGLGSHGGHYVSPFSSMQPALSINNVSQPNVTSGTTTFTFTVTLSAASTQTVTVNYATADGTAALKENDYQSTSGTLTFNPGDTSETITVVVNGTNVNEADETFFVNLTSPVNASLANSQGTGTIQNSAPYPTLSINSPAHTIPTSGTLKFNFQVTLSAASGQTVTVNYATADGTAVAGTDYQAVSGTLTFAPGQTVQTITVPVYGTTAIEPFKNFYVNLSGNSHAILLIGQGVGTLQNKNLQVSINNITADEPTSGYVWANFTVSLSAAASFPVTVNYATGAGGTAVAQKAYVQFMGGLLTINPGQTSVSLPVAILADPPTGTNETFYVVLSNPTDCVLGANWKGMATIIETVPPPTVSVTGVTRAEGNGGTNPFTFNVNLSAPSAQTVTVNYATADGTAVAGTDYQAANGTVSFAPGQTSQTVTVGVFGNTTPQPDRTFYVNLTNPVNATLGTAQAAGTILDDDPNPIVSINNVSLLEGNSGTKQFNFTVSLSSANSQTVTVQYATADGTAQGTASGGTDYVSQSGTLTFNPGQTSKVVTVLVNGNTTPEPDKTFYLNLTGATNARIVSGQGWSTGTGTILNDDLSLSVSDVTVTQPYTDSEVDADFQVTLSAAAAFPVTVNYITLGGTGSAAGHDYVPVSGTLTFAPGQTSQTVGVPIFFEYYSEDDEFCRLKLTGSSNAMISRAVGIATIENTTPLTLSVTNATQIEGNSGQTGFVFTVTLTGAQHEQSVTLQYATADGTAIAGTDYQATSGTLIFGPYGMKETVTVWVYGNTVVEPNKTFYLNVSSPFGNAQGVGTIVNDDGSF